MTPPRVRAVKVLVFAACLMPALRFGAGILQAYGLLRWDAVSLGPDPTKFLLHGFGKWTLNFLMITLCMTPLRAITGWNDWLRFRRMLGLFAFFYVLMHFSVYLFIDQEGHFGALGQDIAKRPYITIGMLGLLLLIPLAATSTSGWQRRLGRRWIALHRLVYVVVVLGVWHFWWQVKKDIREPLLYALGVALLLGFRMWRRQQARLRVSATA